MAPLNGVSMKIVFKIVWILILFSLPVSGDNQDRGLIGKDDRLEVEFDHFATPGSQYLGLLEVNGVLGCSAVMVGPKHIATVPHCFMPYLDQVKINPGLVKFHLHYSRGKETTVSTVTSLEIP